MKPTIFLLILTATITSATFGQTIELKPGNTIEKHLAKGDSHLYTISLKKGGYAELVVMQKGVDLAIDLQDPSGKKLATFDSPNGKNGPEPLSISALQSGKYQLRIYPGPQQIGVPDSVIAKLLDENQGDYAITSIQKMTANQVKQNKDEFASWVKSNAHEIKTVDAGNGFEDLQPFKTALKDVQVVGLGEATHGTSEFFRMKHRMLEFLVKEMGFTSFYIEASMSRCRHINDFVLHGKGTLDTATAIQGFVCWRVDEFKNMLEWMRQYNTSVPEDKKVKFYGYDLQINDTAIKRLKEFYTKANLLPQLDTLHLDTLNNQIDSLEKWSNGFTDSDRKRGGALCRTVYPKCLSLLNDMALNDGKYRYACGSDLYEENLMNAKLIVQEVQTYSDDYGRSWRDYCMAENILYLLNREKPGTKVIVWAHNGHIAKSEYQMGDFLTRTLHKKYYPIGFEFYSGSFYTRNLDINNRSKNWDIMTAGEPTAETLAWYFNKTGKDKFFIDFRNTGANRVKNFEKPYEMHAIGSGYSTKEPTTYPFHLSEYDGMIYIKVSTAAKNFTKVDLHEGRYE